MNDPDPAQRARAAIAGLSLAELLALRDELQQRIADVQRQEEPIPVVAGRAVVAVAREGHITYRQELIRCGKPTCRCAAGQLHGPYWYRYFRKGGRLVSEYVGKQR